MNNNLSRTLGIIILISFNIAILWLVEQGPATVVERIQLLHLIIINIIIWNIVEIFSFLSNKDRDIDRVLKQELHQQLNRLGRLTDTTKVSAIQRVLLLIGDELLQKCNGYRCMLSMILVFTIIPRLLVGINLMINVTYYTRLELMYKDIVLLLIPIIFNKIIGMMRHAAELRMKELEKEGLKVSFKEGQLYVQRIDIPWEKARYLYKSWTRSLSIITYLIAIDMIQQINSLLYWRIIALMIYIYSCMRYLIIS